MKIERPILYIDPQSSGNLAAYDHGVLCCVSESIVYACSCHYDYEPMPANILPCPIFRYNKISNPVVKLLSYLWSMLSLWRLIARGKPRLIHVQWLRIPHFDYAFYWLVKKLYKPTLLLTAHNVLPHNTGNRYRSIFGKVYRLFDHIIVHAEATRQEIESGFNINDTKISVIHHGTLKMSIDHDKLIAQQEAFMQKYPIAGKTVFTSLGEQSGYKGIDLLTDIWQHAPELNSNPNILIIFAGKNVGIDFSPISGFSNVIITDERISNEEYNFLLTNTDVYLLPYRKISQSGALFTAMEEHVPMIVSDAGGLAEPLAYANIGWKIKAGDKESLRQILLHLAAHPDEIKKVRNNIEGWETVCNKYNWKSISQQTDLLYNKYLS